MSDNKPEEPECQGAFQPYIIKVRPFLFANTETCPTALMSIGTNPNNGRREAWGITCRRWSCSYCAKTKIRRLSWLTQNGKPNRLLTLTLDPSLYASPRDAFEKTSPKVAELVRSLRVKFNEIEYLRVTEVTKQGYPHYHLLMRSSFLPHGVVRSTWHKLTQAKIVDLRKVTSSFRAYTYLVKYLTKMHQLEWTERHVSYSRNFFNPADLEKWKFPEYENIERTNLHPFVYLQSRFPDEQIEMTGAMRWNIPADDPEWIEEVDPATLGLPVDKMPPEPEPSQQTMFDMTMEYV